jgi:carbamoyl-phosphate synthase large subunit
MNLLFTGAGRRNYVIEDFRQILNPSGGVVFAMNSHPLSPALDAADHALIAPLASDPTFPDFLLDTCSQYKIGAICTLIDTDMHVLSNMRNDLMRIGTRLILPGAEALSVCRDKVMMNEWLRMLGLPVIPTFNNVDEALNAVMSGTISFPLMIKPRRGTGSLLTYRVCDEEELIVLFRRALREIEGSPVTKETGYQSTEALIIQEFIRGTEFSLDLLNNLNGQFQCVIVKEKIAMRSGETDIAMTVDMPDLFRLGRKIAIALKHPFLIDMDLIVRDGIPYVMDMNPRIGGGYPFSTQAGVRLTEALVRWLKDDEADVSSILQPEIGKISMKGICIRSALSPEKVIWASPPPHSRASPNRPQ